MHGSAGWQIPEVNRLRASDGKDSQRFVISESNGVAKGHGSRPYCHPVPASNTAVSILSGRIEKNSKQSPTIENPLFAQGRT
jgi:hypothetical protein